MKAALTIAAVAAALLAATPAEADGMRKASRAASPTVQVYEPREAPPLVLLSVLGGNLVVWEDFEVNLFDDEDPLPPRVLRFRDGRHHGRRR